MRYDNIEQLNPFVRIAGYCTLAFMVLPIFVVIPLAFSGDNNIYFPPTSWSPKWIGSIITSPKWRSAFSNSFQLAFLSASFSVILGGLASYGIVRGHKRIYRVFEINFMLPILVPGAITALAFYFFLARFGLIGSFMGLLLSHAILSTPIVIIIMINAIRKFDMRVEYAAWSLGASWFETLRKIVIPLMIPSLLAAWIFAFAISFDEVVITAFIAGSIETVPKTMYQEILLEVSPTITAASFIVICFNFAFLGIFALIGRRFGILHI